MFDTIASEYGYTLDQFMAMTARELFIAMSNISKRTQNDYHFQAKLHGLEFKNNNAEKVSFSKADEEFLSKQIERINKERFGT